MLKRIKNFFVRITPSKRKIIQLYAALLHNANISGFITGKIHTGDSKLACLPGLNCYSCPGAVGACPLGSLQNALAESKTKLPTYILGIILLYSIILGRTICGYLCPMGLIQELLYKIKSPKLKKNKITRVLSYFKYVLLVVLVIALPLIYGAQKMPLPAFCKYICPSGTSLGAIFLLMNPSNNDFFSMLGSLFTWKFLLLILFLVGSVFIFRFFCRFFCPLGAIYGLFNKISILGIKVDKSKCTNCSACINHCKMDVKEVGDHECIQCGECRSVCHCNAISWKTLDKIIKEDDEIQNESTDNYIIEDEKVIIKKSRKISKKKFNIITSIIAILLLVGVMLAVNIKPKVYEINSVCDELNITLFEQYEFDIKSDDKNTLLYFYEDLYESDIETLKGYADSKLNIFLISNYNNEINSEINNVLGLSNKQENKVEITSELVNRLSMDYNIIFAYDNKNSSTLKSFNVDKTYPYSVFIDTTDKVLIKTDSMISYNDYRTIIRPSLSGIVGNQVGNICINKEIGIIGSDEKFSVSNNSGKITVINFWYTSCTPCVQELPHFDKVYKEFSDDVVMIAIHNGSMYENDKIGVKDYIDSQFADFTILFGYDDASSPYYTMLGGKEAWPMTVIVDQYGFITLVSQGSLTELELKTEIEKLLN